MPADTATDTSNMTPSEINKAKLAAALGTAAAAPTPTPAVEAPPPAAPAAPVAAPPTLTPAVEAVPPTAPAAAEPTPAVVAELDKARQKLATNEGRLKAEGAERARVQHEKDVLTAKNAELESRLAALEARAQATPGTAATADPDDADEQAALQALEPLGDDAVKAFKQLADIRARRVAKGLTAQVATLEQRHGETADKAFTSAVLDSPARVQAVSNPQWDAWVQDPANRPAYDAARTARDAATMRRLVDRFAREAGIPASPTSATPAGTTVTTPPRPSIAAQATPANAGRAEGTFAPAPNQPLSVSQTRQQIDRLRGTDRAAAMALSRQLTAAIEQGHSVP